MPAVSITNPFAGNADLILIETTNFDDNVEVNSMLLGPLCAGAPSGTTYIAPINTVLAANVIAGNSVSVCVVDQWGGTSGVIYGGQTAWVPI